jgi:glycosidase
MEKETPDDPATWVFTAADKLAVQLIAEVHRRGMRIIFDGVWNHMGINSWAFRDVVKNQQRSRYKDWFTVTSWDDPAKGTKFDYKGWFGHKTLPELRQDENGTVSGPKAYIFAATRRWMDPNGDGDPSDGIDGWRLDVAFCIKHPFWKDWRRHVKAINPQAYTTAEVIEPVDKLRPYLQGDEFDAVMNYNFAFLSAQYFLGDKTRLSATAFDRKLQELRVAFPASVAYVQQNLFGSHDTNRIGSHIVNRGLGNYGDWGDYFGKSQATNPHYNTRKPTAEELRLQKLFVIFQMTYVGAPMIYYGDEAGMWGANDPCCRKPMVWDDLRYDDEAILPDGTTRSAPDKVEVNHDLLAHYKKLIAIRNAHMALTLGNFHTLLADDDKNVFAFSRRHGNETILVVLNNSAAGQKVMLEKLPAAAFQDLLNDRHDYSVNDGRLLLPLEAHWGAILLAN